MSMQCRRKVSRKSYEIPVQYGMPSGNTLKEATLCNFSPNGFYLEPAEIMFPNAYILIFMKDYLPDSFGPESYRSYLGQIKWINKKQLGSSTIFGIGTRLIVRSHQLLNHDIQKEIMTCDLCGNPTYIAETISTGNHFILCKSCHKHLCAIQDEKMKACIDRSLMGNIL